MKKLALAALIAVSVCHPALAKGVDTSTIDFGPAPDDPIESAKPLMATYLKDAGSADYRWERTYKGYCKAGSLNGGGVAWKGWAVTILINAKNSFGGYTGFAPVTVLFSGQSAVRIMDGANFGALGPSRGMLGLSGGAGVCQMVE